LWVAVRIEAEVGRPITPDANLPSWDERLVGPFTAQESERPEELLLELPPETL